MEEKIETYESILKRKIEYYGDTEAAREFAAEEYANIKMIEENIKVLRFAEKHGLGGLEYLMHSRIEELEKMFKFKGYYNNYCMKPIK